MHKSLFVVTPLMLSLASVAALGQTAPAAAKANQQQPGAQEAAPQQAAPEHPLTDAQAHELMQLSGTDKLKDQLVANATVYFKRTFPPFMPKDVLEDINASLEKSDMNTPVVAIYKKYLSTEDATKIIEFYKTPAGKDLVKTNPQITAEAQRSAGQTAQQIVREVLDRHKSEIETAQKAYQDQHKPPTLGAPSTAPGATKTTPTAPATKPTPPS